MKPLQLLTTALLLAMLVAVAGCASKTVTEPVPTPASAPEPEPMPTTDVGQQPAVSAVESQRIESGPVAVHETVAGLERIHFAYNEFTLDERARVTLEQNAVYMRKNPALRVIIEGHCDERGSDEYNLALGERRATASRNYLVSLGIASDRLSVISYGEELPLVAESNEAAWAKNRRAEFKAVR